jgi:hypothetical protein
MMQSDDLMFQQLSLVKRAATPGADRRMQSP